MKNSNVISSWGVTQWILADQSSNQLRCLLLIFRQNFLCVFLKEILSCVQFVSDIPGGRQSRDESVDEENEEASRFMIQLLRWRDDSGHQDQATPTVAGETVDMYQLYRAVMNAGGYNRCNQEDKWADLVEELELPADGGPELKEIYHTWVILNIGWVQSNSRLIYRFIDWFIAFYGRWIHSFRFSYSVVLESSEFIDWFFVCTVDWLIDFDTDRLIDWSIVRLIDWLIDWLILQVSGQWIR